MSIGLNCESHRVEQSSRTSLRKIGKDRERDDDVQSEEYEDEFADRKAKKSRVLIDRRVDTEGKMDGRTDTWIEKREDGIWSSASWLISSRNHESRACTRATGRSQG